MHAEQTPPLRVLLADARGARRDRIQGLVSRDPGLVLVDAVRTGADALRRARDERPDVLLLAPEMPEMDGITALRVLDASAGVPAIVLCDDDEVESALDAISVGARGYLMPGENARLGPDGYKGHFARVIAGGGERRSAVPRAPACLPTSLVTIPAGEVTGLAEALRGGAIDLREALYVVLDAPSWFVAPLARRLHRSTPWRVLSAAPGDALAPGHALLASVDDGLVPVPDVRRLRLQPRASWRTASEAILEISTGPLLTSPIAGIAPRPERALPRAA